MGLYDDGICSSGAEGPRALGGGDRNGGLHAWRGGQLWFSGEDRDAFLQTEEPPLDQFSRPDAAASSRLGALLYPDEGEADAAQGDLQQGGPCRGGRLVPARDAGVLERPGRRTRATAQD